MNFENYVVQIPNPMVALGYDSYLRVWNFRIGEEEEPAKKLENGDYGYVAVRDGIIVTTRSSAKEILIWNYTAGVQSMPETPAKVIPTGQKDWIYAIDVSNTRIATASGDGSIAVIEINP